MVLFFCVKNFFAAWLLSGIMHGMEQTELERAQKALGIWRMQKINQITRPLPKFTFKDSSGPIDNTLIKGSMCTSSFFSEKLNRFFIQRTWKFIKYEQRDVIQGGYTQPYCDCLDLQTQKMTVEPLPLDHRDIAYQSSLSEGLWYFIPDRHVEAIKEAIQKEVSFFVSAQEKTFKIEHVRFSDDFLYMLCLVIDPDGDFVVLFYPSKPLRFGGVKKLADCHFRFVSV